MKALFVPHYFYLHADGFSRVIKVLNQSGHKAFLVFMSSAFLGDPSRYSREQFAKDGCPTLDLCLPQSGWQGTGTLARATRIPGLLRSRSQVRAFLRSSAPDVVVVGSDLGRLHIRILLDECRRQSIPILVMATSGVGLLPADSSDVISAPWPGRLLLRWLGCERSMTFQGTVIGTFSAESTIAVPGEALKQWLVSNGILPTRISVTGDPGLDLLHEYAATPADSAHALVSSQFQFRPDDKIITLCSEVIDEIYGHDYLRHLNQLLRSAFDSLPPECKVVVKLHPRETAETRAVFRRDFAGDRYRIAEDIDLLALFRASHLCVGHFSQALTSAILMGTSVLTINLQRDSVRALLNGCAPLAVVESEEVLSSRLQQLIYDDHTRSEVRQQLAGWVEYHAVAADGCSAQRAADLVVRLGHTRRIQA